MPGTPRAVFAVLLFASLLGASSGQARQTERDTVSTLELKRKSLEELMEIDISSLSKREERLFTAPAAVQVITGDDIRRSGATTLPEALRLASNLVVSQIDSRQWAISARGFNGSTSNKLLVLIDGRSVYTPLFSGVFWDVQNVFLPDVDRIEVISGPGGTLWGANAINGVINVITKSTQDALSNGLHAYGGAGTREQVFGGVRYGGHLGSSASFRVYGMYMDAKDSKLPTWKSAQDDWKMGQAGMKMEWNATENDRMIFQGDGYEGTVNQPVNDDISVSGFNILSRWERRLSEASNLELQFYLDHTYRKIPGTFGESLDTYDFDVQHRFLFGDRHDVVWGAGFRYSDDHVQNSLALAFLPPNLAMRLFTGFVQDEITIIPNTVRLTLGSKFENNDFSGFEAQPGGRVSWLLSENTLFWSAVSRAVRTPSRIDRDLFAPGSPPYFFLAGGPNFQSEKLIAYEIGYRQSSTSFGFDLSTFYNVYDDLRSLEPGPPPILQNGLEGISYGAEFVLYYQPTDWWTLKGGYRYLQKEIRVKASSRDVNKGEGEGNDPKHVLKVFSSMDLPGNLDLDLWLRIIDKLPKTTERVPGVTALDLSLGWKISHSLMISFVGKHILEPWHAEFGTPVSRKQIQRGFFGRIQWTM